MTSSEMIDSMVSFSDTGISGFLFCQSGRMEAEKSTESLQKLDLCKLSRGFVELLLDISEESCGKEQEAYEIPDQAGWDEAVSKIPPMHLLLIYYF